MARQYAKKRQDPTTKIEGTKSFSLGLSQLGHPSVIKPNELAESQNVLYTLNGVLEKRPGSQDMGTIRGSSTHLIAMNGVYNIGGVNYFLRISNDGILQKYVWASELWVDISGSPTFSDVKTRILQAWGKVYILNSTDNMVNWDGSSFNQKTALADPTVDPVLAKVGTATGTRLQYYRYAHQNDGGQTLASDTVSIGSLPEKMDAATYVTVTMPSAPSGTTKTMIFRGTSSGDEMYLASIDPSVTVYNDKDFDSEDLTFGIPADNTTAGVHFKDGIVTVYKDALIGVTVELGDDTIIYSAGLDKMDSFGRADGAGFFDFKKGDGTKIKAVHEFQESLYIFKESKIGSMKFDLSTGVPVLSTISLASGAVSQDSVHAAGNDLRYWSKEGAMALGNEPNYATMVRTKILSARADRIVQAINPAELDKICSIFYKSHSLWGLPQGLTGVGNTTVIAYNEKFAAWGEWFGLKPSMFAKVIDPDNTERLFFSDALSANVCEGWVGRDDRGNAIVWRVSTKQFDANISYKYKTYNRVYFVFGNVTGGSTRVVLTENGYTKQQPLALYASNVGEQGFGVDPWGTMEFGDSSGDADAESSGINIRFCNVGYKDLFSLQATFTNDGLSDTLQLMGMFIEYSDSSLPLPSNFELTPVYE
jgi:hypothetical protein